MSKQVKAGQKALEYFADKAAEMLEWIKQEVKDVLDETEEMKTYADKYDRLRQVLMLIEGALD